jgi:hypothetical protein
MRKRRSERLSESGKIPAASPKPEAFYELVRQACDGRRLELFARERRDGFDSWGNELPPADARQAAQASAGAPIYPGAVEIDHDPPPRAAPKRRETE